MWCWTFFICLVGVCSQISSQPITKDESDRSPRQTGVGECCPCPTPANPRPREEDDCPCRLRSTDSEAAASLLLPTAVRTDGVFLRLADLEEDVPPFLQPEVELASSVLQTLREATDEEYQEALERDAKRNAMKEAQQTQSESNNSRSEEEEVAEEIITIIVHPRTKDDRDMEDTESQPSHVQESRCLRPSLSSTKTDLPQTKILPKLKTAFNDMARVPKVKHQNLLHKNQMDEDNNIGASEVEEQYLQNGENKKDGTATRKINSQLPLLKLFPNLKVADLATVKDTNSLVDSRPSLLQNIFRNAKENYTETLTPKVQTDKMNWLKGTPRSDMKSSLNSILENAKLSNLWKLRDVELLPPLFKKTDRNIPTKKVIGSERKLGQQKKIDSNMLRDECSSEINDEQGQTNNDLHSNTNVRDVISSASEFRENVDREICENEVPNNSPRIVTQPNSASSTESEVNEFDLESDNNNIVENDDAKNAKNTDCSDLTSNEVSSETSIEGKDNLKSIEEDIAQSEENLSVKPECSESEELHNSVKEFSVDETVNSPVVDTKNERNGISKPPLNLSTVRNDIRNRLQKIKTENIKKTAKNDNESDLKIKSSDLDFIETEVNLLTTTSAPIDLESQQTDPSDCSDKMSKQDLQKLSDTILQRENRTKELQNDNFKSATNKNFKILKTQPKNSISDKTPFKDRASLNGDDDGCLLSSSLHKNSPTDAFSAKKKLPIDVETEASNLTPQRLSPLERSGSLLDIPTPLSLENLAQSLPLDPLAIFKNPLPPLEPLPIFDGIKMKLSDIFRADDGSSEETFTSQENDPNPGMMTDSTTPGFQFQLPPLNTPPLFNLEVRPLEPSKLFFGKSPHDDLGARVSDVFENIVDDLKTHLQKAHEKLKLPDPVNVGSGFRPFDLSDHLESHAKDTLKSIGDKFRETSESLGLNKPILGKSILPAFPRADPDDITEKLKTFHENLKERWDLIHSPSTRQQMYSNVDKIKPKSNILGNPSSLKRDHIFKPLNMRQEFPNKSNFELKNNQGSRLREIQRYKDKPKGTALKIPKTVQVPPLKAVTDKSNLRSMQQTPTARTTLTNYPKTLKNTLKDNSDFQTNPLKKKIIVSFTTTPRPLQTLKYQHTLTTSKPILKGRENKRISPIKDSRGAMSELKPSIRTSSSLKSRQENEELNENEQKRLANRPWPSVTESSFLTKVKEAMKARLPNTKSANKGQVDSKQTRHKDMNENRNEMLNSASEHLQIVDLEPLKENVSYRCRMICTRE